MFLRKKYFKSEQKTNILLKKIIMSHTQELSFNIFMAMRAT